MGLQYTQIEYTIMNRTQGLIHTDACESVRMFGALFA